MLDRLRASEYAYLDDRGHVYLDYTGAGLPARAQLAEHTARIAGNCFGNPHSENPASVASTDLIEEARQAILDYLTAPPGEYAVVFTQNASAACRLVGEAYPFGPRRGLVLTSDNHNSVNGIREFASARGSDTRYVPFARHAANQRRFGGSDADRRRRRASRAEGRPTCFRRAARAVRVPCAEQLQRSPA